MSPTSGTETKIMHTLPVLVAVTLAAFSFDAFPADAMTAGDLQDICLGKDAASMSACKFYILGIVQGMSMGMSIADGKTRGGRPCVPDNLPSSAMELLVKAKMGELLMVYPDDRKLDAAGYVGAIFISRFPCRKVQ
jgi:hypothetical protein